MRHIKIKLVAVLAVAATAIGLSATAAAAPATVDYTVAGGGVGGAVTVTNVGNLVFTDTVGGAQFTCTHLSASGVANDRSHSFAPATPPTAPPLDSALTLAPTSTALPSCTNAWSGQIIVTATGTWSLGVMSKSGTTATGYLDFVALHLALTTCAFDLKGYLPGRFESTTSTFTATAAGGLITSNISGPGCPLVRFANGHPFKLTGALKISPAVAIS